MEMQKFLYTAIEVNFDDFCFRETHTCKTGPLRVGQGLDLKRRL